MLGIVGYGHIGTQAGLLAEALGMQVIYYDVEAKLALGNARPVAALDALLEASDVVTLHVPETPQTFQMIGTAQLAVMKPGAKYLCITPNAQSGPHDISGRFDNNCVPPGILSFAFT